MRLAFNLVFGLAIFAGGLRYGVLVAAVLAGLAAAASDWYGRFLCQWW